MAGKIRVAILDDHQGIIDGYMFRLGNVPGVEVVGAATTGEGLNSLLARQATDVLLLDINAPAAGNSANPYPVLHVLPKLCAAYPDMKVIVISMHHERALIRAVMEAGASGYLFKDDAEKIKDLAAIVVSAARGAVHFSDEARIEWLRARPGEPAPALSPRQSEVLSLAASNPDWSGSDLATRLGIAPSTVRNLLSGAYEKLGVRNRGAAIMKARHLGLITPFPPSLPQVAASPNS
jgi:DNA-binding NarL/FixJ family response regulator